MPPTACQGLDLSQQEPRCIQNSDIMAEVRAGLALQGYHESTKQIFSPSTKEGLVWTQIAGLGKV